MEKHPAPQMGTNGDVIGKRFLAFILDSIIMGLIAGVLIGIGFVLGDIGVMLMSLVAFAVSIVYVFLLEGMYGYTPGKHLLGLVVVKTDGSDCTIGASVLRNLLIIVDSLPTAYLVGIILILVTDENKRVGDFVADTVVVNQR
ncbi:RDD family protein [Natrarchaeobius halalkaliphilus]|uniref:RDD family protein n=1 Tax=Natrarchaeobius halalkaliphilus TaxID=1679091 RepID=A0A3N6P6K9_9EURY|nr:RDD family protein [Natrarchaeobius halalkaliphilus]RQG91465.1 RDD family protein [Natrarchaeobius halalkaliphilus]